LSESEATGFKGEVFFEVAIQKNTQTGSAVKDAEQSGVVERSPETGGLLGECGKTESIETVADAQDVCYAFSNNVDKALPNGEGAGFNEGFESGFLVLDPFVIRGVAEALDFGFEVLGQFLFDLGAGIAEDLLQLSRKQQGGADPPSFRRGDDYSCGFRELCRGFVKGWQC
jgi:hypothetical protein